MHDHPLPNGADRSHRGALIYFTKVLGKGGGQFP